MTDAEHTDNTPPPQPEQGPAEVVPGAPAGAVPLNLVDHTEWARRLAEQGNDAAALGLEGDDGDEGEPEAAEAEAEPQPRAKPKSSKKRARPKAEAKAEQPGEPDEDDEDEEGYEDDDDDLDDDDAHYDDDDLEDDEDPDDDEDDEGDEDDEDDEDDDEVLDEVYEDGYADGLEDAFQVCLTTIRRIGPTNTRDLFRAVQRKARAEIQRAAAGLVLIVSTLSGCDGGTVVPTDLYRVACVVEELPAGKKAIADARAEAKSLPEKVKAKQPIEPDDVDGLLSLYNVSLLIGQCLDGVSLGGNPATPATKN